MELKGSQNPDDIKLLNELKCDEEECSVFRCTQCGKIERKPFGELRKSNDMLSCDCEKRMPWEWIWTKGWSKAYKKQRIILGIDKE